MREPRCIAWVQQSQCTQSPHVGFSECLPTVSQLDLTARLNKSFTARQDIGRGPLDIALLCVSMQGVQATCDWLGTNTSEYLWQCLTNE